MIEDEKLSEMLDAHRKLTSLDYADTPEILHYTFKLQNDAEVASEIAESLIHRLIKK